MGEERTHQVPFRLSRAHERDQGSPPTPRAVGAYQHVEEEKRYVEVGCISDISVQGFVLSNSTRLEGSSECSQVYVLFHLMLLFDDTLLWYLLEMC